MDRPSPLGHHLSSPIARRPRRGLTPEIGRLEDRRLLTAAPTTATMTQTATFPDLESLPTVSNQALLYFGATMGTLTEVDVVTSGSFQTQFSADNLAATSNAIVGTTTGDLAVNLPTGSIPVDIPAVTETFDAQSIGDSTTMAPVTSSSTPQTTVFTDPASLADFTGFARMPMSVTGHAVGAATAGNGDISTGFQTQTSVTITVTYHYTPFAPGTGPAPVSSPSTPPASSGSGTSPSSTTPTVIAPVVSSTPSTTTLTPAPSTTTQGQASTSKRTAAHGRVRAHDRLLPVQLDASSRQARQAVRKAHHGG